MTDDKITVAHSQHETSNYWVQYPEHGAREDDPHYVDFNHYHRQTRDTARCHISDRIGISECKDPQGKSCVIDENGKMSGLELHHAHIEFAVQNSVQLEALEVDYPGVSCADEVGAWVESAENLRWLCAFHHRGAGGAHKAAHSDWEASAYILGLLQAEKPSA